METDSEGSCDRAYAVTGRAIQNMAVANDKEGMN